MPFVLAGLAMGVASFLTGELGIPPAIGIGIAVDLTILVAGLLLSVGIGRALEANPKDG